MAIGNNLLLGRSMLCTKIVKICIHSIALIFSLKCVMSGVKIWGPYLNSKDRGGLIDEFSLTLG